MEGTSEYLVCMYLTDFWISLLIFEERLKSKDALLNNCFLVEARIDFWGGAAGSTLMVKGWIGDDDPEELQKGEVDLNLILGLEPDGDWRWSSRLYTVKKNNCKNMYVCSI